MQNMFGHSNTFRNQYTYNVNNLSDEKVRGLYKLIEYTIEHINEDPDRGAYLDIDLCSYPEIGEESICYANGKEFEDLKAALIFEMAMRWKMIE